MDGASMQETIDKKTVEKLFEVGAHLGMTKRHRHPSVSDYIYGVKEGTEIFNLERTAPLIKNAKTFIHSIGATGGTVLFIGRKRETARLLKEAAESINMPYINDRWIGGTITNFPTILKRIQHMIQLEEDKKNGVWEERNTKLERLLLNRELAKLQKKFNGIRHMKGIPNAVVIVDTRKEHIALREANKTKIPVIGIVNSNCDIRTVTYPIIGNASLVESLSYFINTLIDSYKEGTAKKE